MNVFDFLFDASLWPPRWHCGSGWTQTLGWVHIISDLAIFFAYLSIPAVLLYWCIKRRDIPFNYLLILFAMFIVFCGSGHLVEAIIFWKPVYRFDGLVKLSTAFISWTTVLALVPVIPKVLDFPKLEKLNEILNRDLKSSKKRLELSFQGSEVGLWDWDIPANQINFSNFFMQLLGSASDTLQKTYEDFEKLIHPEDLPLFKQSMANHLENHADFQCKFRMLVKGKYKWFHARGLAHWDENNKPIRMAGSITDIQDTIDNHQKLSNTVNDLQNANKEMENFLYVVSHDLRAPLINIKGFSEELARAFNEITPRLNSIADDKTAKEYQEEIPQAIKFISGSVQKIDYLIEALLKLSRLGKCVLTLENINTKKVVEDQVLAMSHQIKSNNIEVVIGDLPNLVADQTAMQQIFGNLLDNAIKYRDPNRPCRIEIYGETLNDAVRFCVKDNGIGIEEKNFPKVFEMFKRIDPVSTPGEGMGLAYIKTLVKRHQGDLNFKSVFNQGSEFFFTISRHLKFDEQAHA